MTLNDLCLDPVLARAQRGDDGSESLRVGEFHRLLLWGRLPPLWAGNLALHAYIARLQITAGNAARTRNGAWAAAFLLDSPDPIEHLGHDFLNMARRAPRLIPDLPSPVVTIAATLSHDSPGNVYARVAGKDSIGLLAEVLRRFAAFGLQPRRFMLRTEGEQIEDWFWLEPSRPHAPPSAQIEAIAFESRPVKP